MKPRCNAAAKCGVKRHWETHRVKCEQWKRQTDSAILYSSVGVVFYKDNRNVETMLVKDPEIFFWRRTYI